VLGDFLNNKNMYQRIYIKFCHKNGIKYSEVLKMLNVAFGESTVSQRRVYEWYKRFKDGREDIEDDERPGRPNTSITDSNVKKVENVIMESRRITIREIAKDLGIIDRLVS